VIETIIAIEMGISSPKLRTYIKSISNFIIYFYLIFSLLPVTSFAQLKFLSKDSIYINVRSESKVVNVYEINSKQLYVFESRNQKKH
jgi:hypothetical protein